MDATGVMKEGLIRLQVSLDHTLLDRLARRAQGARDWNEALRWVLDALDDLVAD